MSMKTINNLYSNYGAQNINGGATKKAEDKNSKGVDRMDAGSEVKQTKLSKSAQEFLEKLKKKYSKIDFMVADYGSVDEARQILSRGTKEVSVLFSSEELEKMASDEKYEKEYLDRVDGALRMSAQINREFGFESAQSKSGQNGEITKIGISFNGDGTQTYFAELEKTSAKQREHIDSVREKRAEEKKLNDKKNDKGISGENKPVKRVTIQAVSKEELIKKMNDIDWSSVKEDNTIEGAKFDLTV